MPETWRLERNCNHLKMGIIIRQSIKGTIVNYIGVVVGFFTTFFVATRFLTAEEIGLTRVLLDAAMLFSSLAQLGTGTSIVRFYPYFKDDKHNDHGFFFWSVMVPLLGFIVFSCLFWALRDMMAEAFSEKSDMFVTYYKCIFPLAFSLLYMSVSEANANVLMRIVVPKFVREVGVRVLTLLVYFLYAFSILDLDGFVYAFCGVYAVALVVDVFYLFSLQHISFKPDFKFITPQLRRDYLLYTLFLITSVLSSVLAPFANSFFISAKMGLTYTGIFAIASYITALIEIPYRSLGAIAQPQLSRAIKENAIDEVNHLIRRVSFHQLLAGAFMFLLIWMNLDLLFMIIPNGEQYASAKWVVFLLSLSKLYNSICSIGLSVLNYSRFYYYSLIFSALFTLLSIVLNNCLIPLWGMEGAALATLLASAIYYSLLLLLNYIKLKTSPLSLRQLAVVGLFLFFGVCDVLWKKFVVAYLPEGLMYALCSAVVQTLLFALLAIVAIYRFRLSSDVNSLIDSVLKRQSVN